MSSRLQQALEYEEEQVTAAETMPFGDRTQITKDAVYKVVKKVVLREKETGRNTPMDVCFLIKDDAGVRNHISYSHFKEFR